ncbi:MAG TPA: hypothetical protein VHZ03_02335 [Trebonia sp.]|jgi:hypothetical protein|nr:hypothetical protein [Trebonia sp.]
MPTVTVQESVTLQQAATALKDKLGSRYEVTTYGSGAHEALKVKQSAASTATVHLTPGRGRDRIPRSRRRPGHLAHGQRVRHRQESSRRDHRSLRREIVMAIIVVARLRLRDPSFLDEFFTHAVAVLEQAQKSDGNLGADALAEAHDVWWDVR